MRWARPAFSTRCRNTPSAVGDRQILPVQTNRTLIGSTALTPPPPPPSFRDKRSPCRRPSSLRGSHPRKPGPLLRRSCRFDEQALFQRLQPVPELGCTLELEVARTVEHLLLEALHFPRELLLVHRLVAR